MLYICEAHASDTWPLKFSHEQPRPTSIEQRCEYAARCAAKLELTSAGFRTLVDTMDDAFNAALCAWPTAYYVVDAAGTLLYVGEAEQGEYGYDVRELTTFVRRWCTSRPARSSPQATARRSLSALAEQHTTPTAPVARRDARGGQPRAGEQRQTSM